MTTIDRFDPFEQRITAAIDEIAAPRRPDYLDDILRQTARTSQRPRWTFPERWLPVDTTLSPGRAGRASLRPIVLVAIVALLALAAAAIFIAGSRPKVPLPVGPAVNGSIVYPTGGDLYIRDGTAADAVTKPLVTGSAKQYAPYLSPDGRSLVYAQAGDGGDYFWAVDIDGKNPRQLLPDPIGEGWSQWSWALDSKHLLVSGFFPGGMQRLYDVQADGSGAREIVFEDLVPWEAFWSPVDANTFLLRANTKTGVGAQGLYLADADGGNLRPLGLPGQSSFGPQYTLSGAVWSPDGKTIAYNAITTDPDSLFTHFRVHVVNADGSNDRELPGPQDVRTNEAWPAYSPDGTQLLVQHFIFPTGQDTKDGAGWIAVLPADGSAHGRDIGVRIDDTKNPDVWKDWSPDGKAVLEVVGETLRAYLVDPVNGTATELPWADDLPAWQRVAR
jgi:Tol biopolymer transport system component